MFFLHFLYKLIRFGSRRPYIRDGIRFSIVFFILLGVGSGSILLAQIHPKNTLLDQEHYLVSLADSMNRGSSYRTRLIYKRQLDTALIRVLRGQGTFDYPFDSLGEYVSILVDTLYPLRLFTWQLRMHDHIEYFGCLQMKDTVIKFTSDNEVNQEMNYELRTEKNWPAALYYTLIPVDVGQKGASYLILGLQRPDMYEKQKIIEVLRISPDKSIRFGAPVFDGESGVSDRHLYRFPLRYSSDGYVTMRYDTTFHAIIFDHLIPMGRNPAGGTKWVTDGSYSAYKLVLGHLLFVPKVFNYDLDKPPMTEEALHRRHDLDILGRPNKFKRIPRPNKTKESK